MSGISVRQRHHHCRRVRSRAPRHLATIDVPEAAFAQSAGVRRHHGGQSREVRKIGADEIGGGLGIYDVSGRATEMITRWTTMAAACIDSISTAYAYVSRPSKAMSAIS